MEVNGRETGFGIIFEVNFINHALYITICDVMCVDLLSEDEAWVRRNGM
jgi:hypothetical protein